MQDLADVALVIRELQFVGRSGYVPPGDRARHNWDSHRSRFRALQHDYSLALADDAARIATALGVTAHRATLWLADGRGKLARWASDGSHYTGIKHLKRVPTGHDSPWIAGEAIASEEVKLKDVNRDQHVVPSWRSVLAIPVFVGDGRLPAIASAVLTFGLGQPATSLLARQGELSSVTEALSTDWGLRLRDVAYPSDAARVDRTAGDAHG